MGALGLIAGLWAEKFDQIAAFQNFIIMPMTFLSGVFYSVQSLPPIWHDVSHLNPFFYMIDGFRHGFFGTSDVSPWLSLAVVGASLVVGVRRVPAPAADRLQDPPLARSVRGRRPSGQSRVREAGCRSDCGGRRLRRLPCGARSSSLPHNSLRSLRSLRSNRCGKSEVEARCARWLEALRSSAPQSRSSRPPARGFACGARPARVDRAITTITFVNSNTTTRKRAFADSQTREHAALPRDRPTEKAPLLKSRSTTR